MQHRYPPHRGNVYHAHRSLRLTTPMSLTLLIHRPSLSCSCQRHVCRLLMQIRTSINIYRHRWRGDPPNLTFSSPLTTAYVRPSPHHRTPSSASPPAYLARRRRVAAAADLHLTIASILAGCRPLPSCTRRRFRVAISLSASRRWSL